MRTDLIQAGMTFCLALTPLYASSGAGQSPDVTRTVRSAEFLRANEVSQSYLVFFKGSRTPYRATVRDGAVVSFRGSKRLYEVVSL